MSKGGFVTRHDATLVTEGDAIGIRGISEFLDAGDHSDVEVRSTSRSRKTRR